MSALPAVDPRAGAICSNCNSPKPTEVKMHCSSPQCSWWTCRRCGANNDAQGRNDITSLAGLRKDGRK